MAFTKINAAGIGSTETVTVDGLTVINNGSFGGNLTVAGVLTYEDVTNVDSVGLITARNGIVVGSGITLSKDGDIFATGITTVSGNVKVGTGITLSPDGDGFYTGVVTATTFKGDGSQLTGVNSDVVDDTSPQLGGDLDTNSFEILLDDNHAVKFGDGSDLQIYHDGTNSIIANTTGPLIIRDQSATRIHTDLFVVNNFANDENLILGNANGAVELYHDNTKRFETLSTGVLITGSDDGDGGAKGDFKFMQTDGTLKAMFDASASAFEFYDNTKAIFGDGDDLQIFHNGTNSFISNTTGIIQIDSDDRVQVNATEFRVKNAGDTETIAKFIQNGAVELYYDNGKTFQTLSGGNRFYGYLYGSDDAKFYLGNSNDLTIYHDGSNNNSYITESGSGNLVIGGDMVNLTNAATTESYIRCTGNAQVELYHDNSLKFETTSTGTRTTGAVHVNDGSATGNRLSVGNGGDLKIYHTNPGSYIEDSSLALSISSQRIDLVSDDGENMARFYKDAQVELYNNGVKQINTHPNGIFTRGIYPMSDNTFDIGSSSQRFKRVYASNGSIQTSDRNQKNTIIESDLGLDFVNKLKPVSYKWNEDDGKTHYGLIAQEVEETLLDIDKTVSDFGAVSKEDDSPMGLSYNEFISPLVKAIQELTAKNDALEARIKTLEG